MGVSPEFLTPALWKLAARTSVMNLTQEAMS
jgi:hypothetical protein